MKTSIKLFCLGLFLINGLSLSAQDIITLKNGKEIEATVLEIGLKEIKYKAFNNLEGPIITIKKSSVQGITYANGTHDIINKSKTDTVSQNENTPDNSFMISPNLRLKTVPSGQSGGFGLTFCRSFYRKKSCDYLGLGFEKFSISGYKSEPNTKYVSIFLSNKYLFSKYSRHFKPFLLTDIGWSITTNKQELADYMNAKYPNAYHKKTIDDFPNGLYLKPGFGLDYLINKHNSVFIDLCFDMNFQYKKDDGGLITQLLDWHNDFFFLFRLGYIYKF